MTAALVERQTERLVTPAEIELIKTTVAVGATDAELKLFLFDCARQGVHPLDRLLHFTKRGGKYTPITSIDFMRTRAADTGELAGSDDARFESGTPGQPPLWATVKVYRLVQGQKCSFEATARWSEYVPPTGQDHMWRKMPHTMLAKCAEALALRKGFPRQLAGLYATEEMDQAGLDAPTLPAPTPTPTTPPGVVRSGGATPAAAAGGDLRPSDTAAIYPPGVVLIARVDESKTKNPAVTRYLITTSSGEQLNTIKDQLARDAKVFRDQRVPVIPTAKATKWGLELESLARVSDAEAPF
jgi:phage recombination protein Bet